MKTPEGQAALEALPNIGSGNVTVTGNAGGPYTVSFVGALADMRFGPMESAGSLPAAPKLLIAWTLSIASWFAMIRLRVVVRHAKPSSEPTHGLLVQLVSFEAPRAGLL